MKEHISQPILSICIPTYNRTDILRQTLNSIFSQDVEQSLFEVCVSDDSPLADTEKMIKKEFFEYDNLVYKRKVLDNEISFLNCFEVLKMGSGQYLKLCNDTSFFNPDSVSRMIQVLENNIETKPVIFFPMGSLTDVSEKSFSDFNSFLAYVSYWSTWAGAFGIWKKDFSCLLDKNIINNLMNDVVIDKKFPHTAMLFNLSEKKTFFVDNYQYTKTLPVETKGGYNLPEVFGVKYIRMIQELYDKRIITYTTTQKIKSDIFEFVADWNVNVFFEPKKFTFDFSNVQKYITASYGDKGCLHYCDVVKQKIVKRQLDREKAEEILLEKKARVELAIPQILHDKKNRLLYVWGIGANAKIVEEVLAAHGIQIDGYIDKCGGDGMMRNGLPVKLCKDVLCNNVYVVVSMKNVDSTVFEEFRKFGYSDYDFCCPMIDSK